MEDKKSEWKLESIRLRMIGYGEDEGKYEGSIEFENGEDESFKFKIRPEMAEDYISLISEELVKGAEELSGKLRKSLKSQGLIK